MARQDPLNGKLVVLLGGSGFVGTHVAQALLERGARLRIASRNPEQAFKLKPLANLGQIQFARCDVTRKDSVEAAMRDADAAVYLVGSFSGDQKALHVDGARCAAEAAKKGAASSFVYLSGLGVDKESEARYARTKALGEEAVLQAFPKATIMRPAAMFGEDDNFIQMFGGLIAMLPALPVFGSEAELQPLWVDDAAEAIAEALANPGTHGGKTYEIAGPDTFTMGELYERIARAQGRARTFLPVPDFASSIFAALPGTPMNSDQWILLKRSSALRGDKPGLENFRIEPHPLGLFLDKWMTRYRKHGRFGKKGLVA